MTTVYEWCENKFYYILDTSSLNLSFDIYESNIKIFLSEENYSYLIYKFPIITAMNSYKLKIELKQFRINYLIKKSIMKNSFGQNINDYYLYCDKINP